MSLVYGTQDYVLGKGEVWFAPFVPGTQTPRGYRWIGNTTEFNMTFESENSITSRHTAACARRTTRQVFRSIALVP